MIIYPAIDMIGGKCVRLTQGRYDDVTVYGDDPVAVAKGWQEQGAQWVHLVDLDGAKSGKSENLAVVEKIAATLSVPVQLGGGIRDMAAVERCLSCGVSRVILGTKAVQDRTFLAKVLEKYGDKIAVGIDAKDGYCATDGWEKVSALTAVEFAKDAASLGARTIIYTDIATDGMLSGPNLSAMREMAAAVPQVGVIASGGVSSAKDITALLDTGVAGAITGRALYTGNLTLADALKAALGGAVC
ncbi:MAG: 1-(5-phosphoribosyl)-5-[(5-phosphoribosylamino)methylideneamino]imidazole-4-carboxamide isomerase [Ruminococcaceae bacterium]|nr:1-(5-phosphoribosyl)-5-[(5-phosphoribosylamino)methylideneamino]imidazole-4-carboxamide isomerase [Oscillospiraceae bacterium]